MSVLPVITASIRPREMQRWGARATRKKSFKTTNREKVAVTRTARTIAAAILHGGVK